MIKDLLSSESLPGFEEMTNFIVDIDSNTTPKIKDLIQDIHLGEKPFIFKDCKRKDHFILSYAFSKSILRIIPIQFLAM